MTRSNNIKKAIVEAMDRFTFGDTETNLNAFMQEEYLERFTDQLRSLQMVYRNQVIKKHYYYGKAIWELKRKQRIKHRSNCGETAIRVFQVFRQHEDVLNWFEMPTRDFNRLTATQIQDLRTFIETRKQERSEDHEALLGGANVTESMEQEFQHTDINAFLAEFNIPDNDITLYQ